MSASLSTHRRPLGHDRAQLIETIDTKRLIDAYRRKYAVAIGPLFEGILGIGFYECAECELGFFAPAVSGTAEFYSVLSRIPWYYLANKEEFRLAARRIKPDQHVLEVGCGRGEFARRLTRAAYTGLEFNPLAVTAAKEQGLDVRSENVEQFAAEHADGFDAVCAFQVLEHVTDPASFIAACAACTRPGGLIFFGVPNSASFQGGSPDDLLNMPPHHLTWWNEGVFWRIAGQFGLEFVAAESERLQGHHRGIYAHAFLARLLMRRLARGRRFLFDGALHRAVAQAARILKPLALVGISDPSFAPVGQTVLAALRKPLST